jgi:predicted DNA-binding protein (UPF0251 family)
MPRPKRCRRVCCDPKYKYYKPRGVPLDSLTCIDLAMDELEALRLADGVGMTQCAAAARMGISQPTFNRIISGARNKVANGLVNGNALRIEWNAESVLFAEEDPDQASARRRKRGGRL